MYLENKFDFKKKGTALYHLHNSEDIFFLMNRIWKN